MSIQDWLNDAKKDYATGVLLYDAAYGKGRWRKKYTDTLPEKLLLKKLAYYLRLALPKYASVTLSGEQPKPVIFVSANPIVMEEPVAPIVYTDNRMGKELMAKHLYREVGKLRADLFSDDINVRRVAALSIKEKMKRNRQLWDEINYFDAHGISPSQPDDSVSMNIETASIADLIAMKQNLAPWCSKEKKKIANETDPAKKKERETALLQKLAQLDLINQKLKSV